MTDHASRLIRWHADHLRAARRNAGNPAKIAESLARAARARVALGYELAKGRT